MALIQAASNFECLYTLPFVSIRIPISGLSEFSVQKFGIMEVLLTKI